MELAKFIKEQKTINILKMGQRFYLDENDLDGQFDRLNNNLFEMLDFAYIHEDMVNTIEELIGEWAKGELHKQYRDLLDIWQNMEEDEKLMYEDGDAYIRMDNSRWWSESFNDLEINIKKIFIERYRLTIALCMFSNTYDYEILQKSIETSWLDYQPE